MLSNARLIIRTNPAISNIVKSPITHHNSDMQKAEKLFAWATRNISSHERCDTRGTRTLKDTRDKEILREENFSAYSVFIALCHKAHILVSNVLALALIVKLPFK